MVKTKTETYELELEDENEQVDNACLNRNYQTIEEVMKRNDIVHTTGFYDPSVNMAVIIKQSNTTQGLVQLSKIRDFFQSYYDTLYDNSEESLSGAISTCLTVNLTKNRALVSSTNGKIKVSDVTETELLYLSGVSSGIQTQLDSKATNTKVDALPTIRSGTSAPPNSLGKNGDIYIITG